MNIDRDRQRIVLITRRTRYEELVARYHTAAQAKFYVEHLGADFADYEDEHRVLQSAVQRAERELSAVGRVQRVERSFLPNFLFGPDDLIVVAGQDGLVANALKYVGTRPVIGINPDPARIEGRLVSFAVEQLRELAVASLQRTAQTRAVTLARATLSDGQSLLAVNDLFLGCRTHASARYELAWSGHRERQSSSGIIVSTGLGSTGWLRSVLTGARGLGGAGEAPERATLRKQGLPWEARKLLFSVREPYPSRSTAADVVFGEVDAAHTLRVTSQMPDDGVIFSDGVERDSLEFSAGLIAEISLAPMQARLVH